MGLKELLKRVKADGWLVEKAKNGHYKLTHPCGGLVFVSLSPSDHRALLNIRGDIRREMRKYGQKSSL